LPAQSWEAPQSAVSHHQAQPAIAHGRKELSTRTNTNTTRAHTHKQTNTHKHTHTHTYTHSHTHTHTHTYIHTHSHTLTHTHTCTHTYLSSDCRDLVVRAICVQSPEFPRKPRVIAQSSSCGSRGGAAGGTLECPASRGTFRGSQNPDLCAHMLFVCMCVCVCVCLNV